MSHAFDLIFTIEVVTCLAVAAAAAFVLSALMQYVRDRDKLTLKIRRVEKQLEKTRKAIARRKAAIEELRAEVEMLTPVHDRLKNYHEELLQIQLQEEKRIMEEEAQTKPTVRGSENPWD